MRVERFRAASRADKMKIEIALAGACAFVLPHLAFAQAVPIAIVPIEGVKLTGAMEIPDGKAAIESNGSITAGDHTATVTLPHRGSLLVCQSTKVNLLTDSSVAANQASDETAGLMMALDRGALEANFSTRKNSDVILTPGYRVVISGPGVAAVQVRLGEKGDLCVDNKGENAPYVTVSSIFEGGVYRVNANQRVSFQHGSLNEVVDNEKEPCGCPPEAAPVQPKANDFPIAQSEGLAPLAPPPPNAVQKGTVQAQAAVTLGYDGAKPPDAHATAKAETAEKVELPPTPKPALKPKQKMGFFGSVGHFFRRLFGG
jgi:hypothetical protein